METATEDGEPPSLLPVAAGVNNVKPTPSRGNEVEYSRKLSFISRSIISPISKGKSPSFKKYEEDIDLMVEYENELDEPVQVEGVSDDASPLGGLRMVKNSWADFGVQEYSLILMRRLDNGSEIIKLEAKIKMSAEYPLRPPHFDLSIHSLSQGEDCLKGNDSMWSNELRAMEAEVNVHIIKMIPFDQENSVKVTKFFAW